MNHQGKRKAKRIGDRETAQKVAKAIRARIAARELRLGPVDDETLNAYAHEWIRGLTGSLKASTILLFGKPSAPRLAGARQPPRIGVVSKGLPGSGTLSAVLSQAVEDEKLPANPALRMGKYLRRGDEPERVILPLTVAETAHIIAVAERHFLRWYPWVLCALRTGLRLGELLALQWGDVDWNGRFLLVQRNLVRGVLTSPKSHQRRRVDITPQLSTALLAWRRLQRKRLLKKGQPMPAWVFPSLEGTALEERNVRHVFARILEKADIRQIRIHDLRHSYATLLLQAGAPITYVCQQLGHRDASIALRLYAHWLPDASRREADRLDTLQPSATPAQPEAAETDLDREAKSFGLNGEPKFHVLEPDWRMAQTGGGASIRCLTAVDEHYS